MTSETIETAIKALKNCKSQIEKGPASYALSEKLEAALSDDALAFKREIEKDDQCARIFLWIFMEAWNGNVFPDSLGESLETELMSLIPPDESISWVLETSDAAFDRNDPLGYDPTEIAEIRRKPDTRSVVIDYVFYDQRPEIGKIVWDSCEIDETDVLGLALGVVTHGIPATITSENTERWSIPPLFKYHPERFKRTRQYLSLLNSDGFFEHAVEPLDMLNASSQYMLQEYNEQSMRVPLRDKLEAERIGKGDITRTVNCEVDSLLFYDAFRRSGRQVFDVSKGISEMLRETSADDIPVSLLKSPYETFYIYFGKQDDIVSGDGWCVDGVYITHFTDDRIIQFQFTSIPDYPEKCKDWVIHQEPTVTIALGPDCHDLKLGDAIKSTLSEREAEVGGKISKGDQDITNELESLNDGQSLPIGKVIQTNETSGKKQLIKLRNGAEVVKRSIGLAVNAMCYLTAYPDDIEREYPAEIPQKMLQKTISGPPKLKKNAVSKLESMGFRKIHMCGRSLHKGPATESPMEEGKRTHWRKGFWREQPHGPKNSLRKLIWIKPVIVNSKNNDSSKLGSIYIGENIVDFSREKKKRQ